jgi:hypothetical protein
MFTPSTHFYNLYLIPTSDFNGREERYFTLSVEIYRKSEAAGKSLRKRIRIALKAWQRRQ